MRSRRSGSAALRLFNAATKLEMGRASTIKIPLVAGLPPQPVFVAEGHEAPALQFSLEAASLGPVRKILLVSAVTSELESSGPEAASTVIGTVLSNATSASVDVIAFDANAGDSSRPPGLLYGATPIPPAAASSTAMDDDLAALVAAIGAAGIDPSNTVFVTGPREAMLIALRAGPKFNFDVLMTLGLPPRTVAAFAPAGIFCGFDGTPTVETSKDTLIHFETAPASDGTLGAPTKTAFQTDLLALKIRSECAWCTVPGAAQSVTGINW
jgi:hypothetical protein